MSCCLKTVLQQSYIMIPQNSAPAKLYHVASKQCSSKVMSCCLKIVLQQSYVMLPQNSAEDGGEYGG